MQAQSGQQTDQINPTEESSQKPKFHWKFILIVLVFAIVVASGTIYFTRRYMQEQRDYLNLVLSQHKTPNAIAVANWQTYTNEQYGFEVKYPLTWKFGDSKELEAIWFAPTDLTNEAWVTANRFGILPHGGLGYGLEYLEPVTSKIAVGGLKAERTDYKVNSKITFSIIKFTENKLPTSWLFNDQRFDLFSDSKEMIDQFNQILSTFKFTN